MASTFPAAIANEPPPLDISSEEEDSDDFRSNRLKLDVPSGEPTPVSTPFKRPISNSPKTKNNDSSTMNGTDLEEDEIVVEVSSSETEAHSLECSPTRSVSQEEILPVENGQSLPSDNEDEVKEVVEYCNPIRDINVGDLEQVSRQESTVKEQSEFEVPDSACEVTATTSNDCDCDTSTSNIDINTNIASDPDASSDHSENSNSSSLHLNQKHGNEKLHNEFMEDEVVNDFECVKLADTTDVENYPETVVRQEGVSQNLSNTEDDEYPEFQTFKTDSKLDNNLTPTLVVENKSTVQVEEEADKVQDEDDFDDDFGAFQSIPSTAFEENSVQHDESSVAQTADSESDDDFGDFAQVPAQIIPKPVKTQPAAHLSSQDSEDFADFQDCSFPSCDVPAFAVTPSTSNNFTVVSSKVDSLIKTLFQTDSSISERNIENLQSIDSEISISNDGMWSRVQDFEGSNSLMFKWLNSLTEKHLLKSLNIDTTTIMYHEKWGTIEVPKFAASLVQSPLQPQSCTISDSQSKNEAHHTSIVANNNNNNITQGVSCQHDKAQSLSSEAQEILRQLPDLAYMRANNLVFPQASPSGL